MPKCVLCNKPIEDSDIGDNTKVIPYKGRLSHKKCFDHIMKGYSKIEHNITLQKEQEKKEAKKEAAEKKIKPVEVENEGLSEEEYKAKRKYYAYLREQLGDVTSKYYVMTDRYLKKYDYTFQGMYQALVYMHDVQDKVFSIESNIVGLIPYCYEDAERYYADLDKCEEANKGKDIGKMYQTRTVKIKKDTKKKRGETWEF